MGVIAAKTTKTKTKSKTTLKVAYNPKYTIAEYGFDTTRKAKWIADELENEAVLNTELLDPAAFICLLYTSPSPRDRTRSRMPSSA